jgi:FKBP-type peptidyl-prolyl cis-trans isomerase
MSSSVIALVQRDSKSGRVHRNTVDIDAMPSMPLFRNTLSQHTPTHSSPRRLWLLEITQALLLVTTTAESASSFVPSEPPSSVAANTQQQPPPRDIRIILNGSSSKLGLELSDTMIGKPPKSVAYIRRIVLSTPENSPLVEGMIIPEFPTARAVQERLQDVDAYPMTLIFRNVANDTNDAISNRVGSTPMVTAPDAWTVARQQSGIGSNFQNDMSSFQIMNLSSKNIPPDTCKIRSQRGDVLEIIYEAHMTSIHGPIYDSSHQRGTGQPYQMVLGSGDMLPGVDLGLYDMCPGEIRGIHIPPPLAYGGRGNRWYEIPPNTALYWYVQLMAIHSTPIGG